MIMEKTNTSVSPTLFSYKGNQTQPLNWISTDRFNHQQKHLELMAGDFRTPVKVLHHLENQSIELRKLVFQAKIKKAAHSLTSESELNLLFEDGSFEISFQLAQNPNISQKKLQQLSSHFDSRIRLAVAQNERTSYVTIHHIALSTKKNQLQAQDILIALVQHPAIAVETLELLLEAKFRKVRKLARKVLKQRF